MNIIIYHILKQTNKKENNKTNTYKLNPVHYKPTDSPPPKTLLSPEFNPTAGTDETTLTLINLVTLS
jgi:hypothetical protein